jgi:hypothetical protein
MGILQKLYQSVTLWPLWRRKPISSHLVYIKEEVVEAFQGGEVFSHKFNLLLFHETDDGRGFQKSEQEPLLEEVVDTFGAGANNTL